MRTQLAAALGLLLSRISGNAASSLATFQDAECKKSMNSITGQDGYPDGVCTSISGAAEGRYQSFMFITLDDGCTPTIYQNDATSDTCSGAAYVAYISKCYNTSWEYYSIDECSPVAPGSPSSTSSTSKTSNPPPATHNGISGGAIAGTVVGSVCGLGIIAAVCVYLFWFRPKQKEKGRKEKEAAERNAVAEAEAGRSMEDELKVELGISQTPRPHQRTPELQSSPGGVEFPTEGIAEAPGDKGGVEVDNDAELPAELPGDHGYRSSDSIR